MNSNILIINYKNYPEIAGNLSIKLAEVAERVAKELKVEIIVAPPSASLALVAKHAKIPVFAQHLDSSEVGSTTGFMVAEIVKSYGVKGSIINHSEHRIPYAKIEELVKKLKQLQMISVVCARTPNEVRRLAILEPDYIAIEPPDLIGSGKAVSKARPSVITRSVEAVNNKVICGAGIVDGSDVAAAIKLGSKGVLVASGIVKADNWRKKISELASALV